MGDLAGLIGLVSPGRGEPFSHFVVFVISKVGVTECAWLGWRWMTWQRLGGEINASAYILSVNPKWAEAGGRGE